MLLPVSGSLTLTNTTDGHDFSSIAGGYRVEALWALKSPVCKAYKSFGVPTLRLKSPPGQYCEPPVAVSKTPQTIPNLSTSESTSSRFVGLGVINSAVGNSNGLYPPEDEVYDSVPESSADSMIAALESDPAIYFLSGGDETADEGGNQQDMRQVLRFLRRRASYYRIAAYGLCAVLDVLRTGYLPAGAPCAGVLGGGLVAL